MRSGRNEFAAAGNFAGALPASLARQLRGADGLSVGRLSLASVTDDAPAGCAWYGTQSRVTDPGAFAGLLGAVPPGLAAMQATARRLVFHYRAGGDYAENGIDPGRIAEIDTRYADAMLARLAELADQPLTAQRPARQRLVGCCRDFTVLFLAIARHQGVPARARVGFAGYFVPGWFVDHVVAEVWDAGQQRWRLVDPELADGHTGGSDPAPVDPLDVPASRFLTGPQAWRACRAGEADPGRFAVDPGLTIPGTRGWPYLRHNLIHDLAALTKRELLLWDEWGLAGLEASPSPGQLALLDDLAAVTSSPGLTVEQAGDFARQDGLRVPPAVTSYSPARSEPVQVTLRG